MLLIFLLLFLNTRSLTKTFLIILAVPFSAIGAIWFLYLLGYNMSAGVWVGMIALLGIDAETGVFMLHYLDLAYEQARMEGRLRNLAELRHAIVEGAARRIRPKFMTVATMFVGLVPIVWATGTGSDVMKRIAAPLIGGLVTSFLLELVVYPALYKNGSGISTTSGGSPIGIGPAPMRMRRRIWRPRPNSHPRSAPVSPRADLRGE